MPLLRIETTHDLDPEVTRDAIAKIMAIVRTVNGDNESMISVFIQPNMRGVFGTQTKRRQTFILPA
jgi:phenylpyruvate tautomerase PptA (4-oxalocrotonate tautomerase family)